MLKTNLLKDLAFEMHTSIILFQLGIRSAFQYGQFRNMAPIPLKLSSVSHVASIDVTNEGTLGAAATGKVDYLATYWAPLDGRQSIIIKLIARLSFTKTSLIFDDVH